LALHEAHRAELVKCVLDNSVEGAWTEKELKAFDTKMLEKLNKQFKPAVDYSAQGAGSGIQANRGSGTEEKLLPIL
jgi:hypothetical protein